MAGMGPAPKPESQQRRPGRGLAANMTRLPAAGRMDPPPAWPFGGRVAKAQAAVWASLWATPQAVEWERLGWTRVVARYARLLLQAERPSATAALLAEVRQLEDRLGLSPMAMLRLRWTVDEAPKDRPVASVVDLAKDPRARLRRRPDDATGT